MHSCMTLGPSNPRYSVWTLFFRNKISHFGLFAIILVGASSSTDTAFAQMTNVSQQVLPTVEIRDLDLVEEFLETQFITPEDTNYNSALFLDVTRDGFGVNDLLLLYPSEEYFQLSEYIPDQMRNVLSEQNLESDYNLSTSRDMTRVIADEAETEEDPKKALAGAMLQSLLVYMPAGNFEGYINQVGDNVRINFWGYDEDAWQFIPESKQCIQPDDDPMIMLVHKMPQIQSLLDVDGCVVIQASTTAAEVTSRVCE